MFRNVLRNTILLGMMSLVMVVMTGCLVSGNSNVTITGKQVPNSLFSQLKVNQTTKDELLALLGPANSSNVSDTGMEVLTYSYTKTKTGGSALFLIWGHQENTTEKETTTFVFRDNILQSYSRE